MLPGHTLDADGVVRRASAPPRHTAWLTASAHDLAPLVRAAVYRAVERATSDARIVAVLLGGVDSSAILSVLARMRSVDTIRAITIDFPGRDPDRPYAAEVCRQLGVKLTIVTPAEWASLSRFIVLDASPYPMLYGGGELAAFCAARAAGADLAVTGVLGDSIFGGHLSHLGTRLLWRHPLRALSLALRSKLPDIERRHERLRQFVVVPNVRKILPRAVRVARTRKQWRRAMPWATEDLLACVDGGIESSWQRYAVPRSPTEAYEMWATSAELAGLVEISHALAQEAGIRWREAFVDADLIDLLSAIPVEQLLDGARFRGLLLRALDGVLPEPARSRTTKAELRADLSVLERRDDRTMLQDLASGDALARFGFVKRGALREAFEKADNHFWIWRFLATEAFLRAFHD